MPLAAAACGSQVVTPGGSGGAAICVADSACDDQNPCTVDTCGADTTCAHDAAALDGQEMPDTQQGNCRKIRCQQGVPASVPDDVDTPTSTSPCIVGTCSDGVPAQLAVPDGTSCNTASGPGVCQTGVCKVSGCECPMPADPCTAAICDGTTSQCVFTPLPDGTPSPNGDPIGNCLKYICLGGVSTYLADDTDAPEPTQCATSMCDNGTPKTPALPAGTACIYVNNQPGVCNGLGDCVQCTQSADCGPNQICKYGMCQ
jgi:hypothetical protein